MMAAMFKVGKHEYIIRAPEKIYDRETCEYVDSREEGEEPHYMYYSDISDIRVEEIHPCKFSLKLAIKTNAHPFLSFVFTSLEKEEHE